MISRQEVIAAEQKRIESTEVTIHSRKQIKCRQGRHERRLFDIAEEGIAVQCKECHREHVVIWSEVVAQAAQLGIRIIIVHSTQVS